VGKTRARDNKGHTLTGNSDNKITDWFLVSLGDLNDAGPGKMVTALP
jgi:hypothetical protein